LRRSGKLIAEDKKSQEETSTAIKQDYVYWSSSTGCILRAGLFDFGRKNQMV
jgi:hypothetical protein